MSQKYLSLGKWKRIPVSLHWTIFLWLPWYYIQQKDLLGMMPSFVAFVALLGPVHSSRFVFTFWNSDVGHGSANVERHAMVSDC